MALPKILLHTCCAPCAGSVVEQLQASYAITLFFDNSNIHPEKEYYQRVNELRKWSKNIVKLPLIESAYNPQNWFDMTQEFASEPEKGRRCTICYQMRLEATANYAAKNDFNYFATVLSISPHKDALRLNAIGGELSQKYSINFHAANFKKKGGFSRSLEISRQNNFYRQAYCGCTYSQRKND